MNHKTLTKPFSEWPSPLRLAFLEGWAVATIGVGKTMRDVVSEGGLGREGILAGAAWEIGHTEGVESGAKRRAS